MGSSQVGSTSVMGAPSYYLSLGDSLSTGVQPIGLEERQFRTDEGYADQLLSIVRSCLPELEAVKLGYPGESTTTMIEGGLTSYPHGSQLREAIAFLRDHRDGVAFVTLDVGFNDFPAHTLEAIPDGMASIERNLPRILDALRQAAGPNVPIVGMSVYDPFLVRWLDGPEGREIARLSVWEAVVPINARFREIYRAAGLRSRGRGGCLRDDRLRDGRRSRGRGAGADQRRPGLPVDLGRRAAAARPGPARQRSRLPGHRRSFCHGSASLGHPSRAKRDPPARCRRVCSCVERAALRAATGIRSRRPLERHSNRPGDWTAARA